MRIAFIGFGEAARAYAASLREVDPALDLSAHDIKQDGPEADAFADAALARGVTLAASSDEAVVGADVVISAVTAASSLEAAQSVAHALPGGAVFMDINSVSPARKRETAALIAGTGATYVDAAVMAPVHPAGHRTATLLAGALPEGFLKTLTALDFRFEVAGEEVGSATAVKMLRSLFVKGLEALTVEALTAARAAGCYPQVYGSLAKSFASLGWPDFPSYQFERVMTHGLRRAAEMRESAATLSELGRPEASVLAQAIASVHQSVGAAALRAGKGEDPAQAADKLLAVRK